MGTEHTVLKSETGVELSAYEMSDRFTLEVLPARGEEALREVTPKDLIRASLRLLCIASYHMDHNEMVRFIEQLATTPDGRYLLTVTGT